MLCFRFRYPYLGIWFSEPYVWISFYCSWVSIILCKRLWNFFWKCQFFVRIYGTMCIVIFLGEVLTSMRDCEYCSLIITSSFLIHGNSSSKTYLANRSFLFVPTKGTLLNGTPIKQYVFDSLRFTIVLSTQIGKWTLQNKIPVLRTLRVPSSRLFLTCRIFSFWNFHFPIFSYDLWNSSENVQSSRKLFFFCPTCRAFEFWNFDFWKKAYDFWKHGMIRFHHFQAVSVISNLW